MEKFEKYHFFLIFLLRFRDTVFDIMVRCDKLHSNMNVFYED